MKLSITILIRIFVMTGAFLCEMKAEQLLPGYHMFLRMICILVWLSMGVSVYVGVRRMEKQVDVLLEQMKTEIQQHYEDEMLNKQAELDALQSQINPHFLYNTLDSIQGQALRSQNTEIAEMTAALSSFFRYSISMKNSIVTIREEIKNVQNYMLIQRYRFGDKISLDINCEEEIFMDCCVPQMILQPLVENAVYHGLERISREGKVTISLTGTEQILHVVVEDNGIGMNEELTQKLNKDLEQSSFECGNVESKSGIALRNVNQRLRLLFGEDYGLHIFNAKSIGTKIIIYLPVNKEIKR